MKIGKHFIWDINEGYYWPKIETKLSGRVRVLLYSLYSGLCIHLDTRRSINVGLMNENW